MRETPSFTSEKKYKINKSQEFVIGGYTPDSPFDALIVGYYDGARLLYVAKIGNGFVPHVRREVFSKTCRQTVARLRTCLRKNPMGVDQARDAEMPLAQTSTCGSG